MSAIILGVGIVAYIWMMHNQIKKDEALIEEVLPICNQVQQEIDEVITLIDELVNQEKYTDKLFKQLHEACKDIMYSNDIIVKKLEYVKVDERKDAVYTVTPLQHSIQIIELELDYIYTGQEYIEQGHKVDTRLKEYMKFFKEYLNSNANYIECLHDGKDDWQQEYIQLQNLEHHY